MEPTSNKETYRIVHVIDSYASSKNFSFEIVGKFVVEKKSFWNWKNFDEAGKFDTYKEAEEYIILHRRMQNDVTIKKIGVVYEVYYNDASFTGMGAEPDFPVYYYPS